MPKAKTKHAPKAAVKRTRRRPAIKREGEQPGKGEGGRFLPNHKLAPGGARPNSGPRTKEALATIKGIIGRWYGPEKMEELARLQMEWVRNPSNAKKYPTLWNKTVKDVLNRGLGKPTQKHEIFQGKDARELYADVPGAGTNRPESPLAKDLGAPGA